MKKTLEMGIEVTLDDKGAVQKVQLLEREVRGVGSAAGAATGGLSSLTAGLSAIGPIIAGLGIGKLASDLVSFGAESARMAREEQAVYAGLAASLDIVGVSYDQVKDSLSATFAEIQRTTKIGDDQSAGALRKLVLVTQDYDAAVKLLQPTLDLSAAAHIDLESAARLVGQAATGMTGTLSRYGVVLDETTQKTLQSGTAASNASVLVEELGKRFGGLAGRELDALDARLQQVNNYWGDFREALGNVINEVVASAVPFDELITDLSDLTAVINGEGTMEGASSLGGALRELLLELRELVKEIASAGDESDSWAAKLNNGLIISLQSYADQLAGVRRGIEEARKAVDEPGAGGLGFFRGAYQGYVDAVKERTDIDVVPLKEFDASQLVKDTEQLVQVTRALGREIDDTGTKGKAAKVKLIDMTDGFTLGVTEVRGEFSLLGTDVEAVGSGAFGLRDAFDNVVDSMKESNRQASVLSTSFGQLGVDAATAAAEVDDALTMRENAETAAFFQSIERDFAQMGTWAEEALDPLRDDWMKKHVYGPDGPLPHVRESWKQTLDDMRTDAVMKLGDLFTSLFTGDFENLESLGQGFLDSFASRAGDNLSSALGQALETWQASRGTANEVGFGEAFGAAGGYDALLGLGGSALSSWGQQQGGGTGVWASVIGGAISGAVSGGGWVGAIVGAVAGYLSASGGQETPGTNISLPWYTTDTGGVPLASVGQGIETWGHQGVGPDENALAVLEVYSLQRSWSQAYRGLLQTFQDENLFDLIGRFMGVSVGGDGDLQTWLRILGETTIPGQMQSAFGPALQRGFENMGLGDEFYDALTGELAKLPGTDRIAAFQAVISGLVTTARLLEDAEWSDLLAASGQGPFAALVEQIDDAMQQIGLLSAGWEDLSLTDRAGDLEAIDQLFESTLANVLSMLAAIQQRQEEIERGWSDWATSLQFSALETGDQRLAFAQAQLDAAFAGLEGAESQSEIDRWNAEVQRWLDQIGGMVDLNDFMNNDPMGNTGGTWLDWLLEQGQRASDLAVGAYQDIEDELQLRYQELYDTLEDVNDRFRTLNDTLDEVNRGFGGGAVKDDPDLDDRNDGGGGWLDPKGGTTGGGQITLVIPPSTVQVVNETDIPLRTYIRQEARQVVLSMLGGGQGAMY